MKKEINILFTSVGRRSYLVDYFKEALDGQGYVHVANSDSNSPAFKTADYFVVTPLIYDEKYINFLEKYCKENHIDCIISLFDIDLSVLARNKYIFNRIGTKVLVSDENVIDICNDKYKTFCYLKKIGVKVPNTYLERDKVICDITDNRVSFPLIIKPRRGMGSIGIYEADNINEMNLFYNKLGREINETYLRYESERDAEYNIIIQQKINGMEYGLDIVNDLDGRYKTTVCKKKYAMRAGETDCAMTVNNPKLLNVGKKIGESIKHIGNMDVDIMVCGDDIYVIEMNARFGGGYPFSHMAGMDLPKAIIAWLKGENEPENSLKIEYNVKSHKDIHMVKL